MKFHSSLILSSIFLASEACIAPSGVGTGPGEISVNQVATTKAALGGIPYLFLPLAPVYIADIVSKYETPIQFRISAIHGSAIYNAVAMYNANALDIFGKDDRRICTSGLQEDEVRAHETIAAAYAFAYSSIIQLPATEAEITNLMDNVLGLPIANLDGTPGVGTPWGLAKAAVDELVNYSASDGWNADGSLANEFNKQPYSDFSFTDANGNTYQAYENVINNFNITFNNDGTCNSFNTDVFWEPLLESDGLGYFTRQEHVTPFIGFTGRLFGITDAEYLAFESPPPNYNYCAETDFVLENTRILATDDDQKMEVELFDSKFTSLLPLQINWSIQSLFSEFDFWYYDMTLVNAMYDATMLVWRDKVIFNGIRPTTIVNEVKQTDTTLTYAGPFMGEDQVRGIDWQPYIRTMPHAEYPSGSSCVCTAFAETLIGLSGSDDTIIPVVQEIPAGSSKIEPGQTPAVDLTFTFTQWSQIQQVCGMSRVNGGMHFSEAVPGGEALCTGLAGLVVNKANLLIQGDASGAMVDITDTDIHVKNKVYAASILVQGGGDDSSSDD